MRLLFSTLPTTEPSKTGCVDDPVIVKNTEMFEAFKLAWSPYLPINEPT